MKCKRVRKLLVEFEDSVLPSEIAKHMDQCSDCCQHSRQMKTTCQLISLKKYERPDPTFEERSALIIRRRIEGKNRPYEYWLGGIWEFLTNYSQPLFRYTLAVAVAALFVINFISLPQLTPIQLGDPLTRPTLSQASATATISFPVPRQSSLEEFQNPSNHGPTHIEYGPRESVPVNFEY